MKHSGLHPHKIDLLVIYKLLPVKVPMPATKKDGRKEVESRFLIISWKFFNDILLNVYPSKESVNCWSKNCWNSSLG